MKYPECERCERIIGPVNFWVNVGLAIFKLFFGLICGSYALLADAIHSLSDIASAVVYILCLWVSGRGIDEEYHYGHGKIEFVGSGIIGLGMVLVAAFIILYSVRAIAAGDLEPPDPLAAGVSLISIMANALLYKHQMCVGEQTGSPLVIAQARENGSDALTSLPAMIGIVGAQFVWSFLDPLAAVFIGVIVMKLAYETLTSTAKGLADAALEPEVTDRIRNAVESVDEVIGIDRLKTRRIGQELDVGVRVKVDATKTVEWANGVARKIRDAVRRNVDIEPIEIGFQGVKTQGVIL